MTEPPKSGSVSHGSRGFSLSDQTGAGCQGHPPSSERGPSHAREVGVLSLDDANTELPLTDFGAASVI